MEDEISAHFPQIQIDLGAWDVQIMAVYKTEGQHDGGQLIEFPLCTLIAALTPLPRDFRRPAR
jgi:hypothetical protein